MVGELERVSVIDARAVHSVGILIAVLFVDSDIELTGNQMHAEKVAVHRGLQPIAHRRRDGQRTETIVSRDGHRHIIHRYIDRPVIRKTVLDGDIGHNQRPERYVRLDIPAIRLPSGTARRSSIGNAVDRCFRIPSLQRDRGVDRGIFGNCRSYCNVFGGLSRRATVIRSGRRTDGRSRVTGFAAFRIARRFSDVGKVGRYLFRFVIGRFGRDSRRIVNGIDGFG